jgi:hypothetical protein
MHENADRLSVRSVTEWPGLPKVVRASTLMLVKAASEE